MRKRISPGLPNYKWTSQGMSFSYHAASYSAAHPASPHTPDAGEYRTENRAPPHIRAPLLRSPSSVNDSYSPSQRRRPSFSSINQPVLDSPTYGRSRAVSSTTRMQPQIISTPSGHFGTAPSGRSRTISSGSSMRPVVTRADQDHSSLRYSKATNGIRPVASQNATGRTKSQHPDQLPVFKPPAARSSEHSSDDRRTPFKRSSGTCSYTSAPDVKGRDINCCCRSSPHGSQGVPLVPGVGYRNQGCLVLTVDRW